MTADMHTSDRTTSPRPGEGGDAFPVTHWSIVRAAGQGDSRQSARALEELCRTYWFPLYAYVRRRGYSAHDAQDMTQGFFAAFLARDPFVDLEPERGKFRAFLLACLKHYISNARDHARALKRGGGQAPVSWDTVEAEERFVRTPCEDLTPDRVYERQWALALLDHVLTRLEAEMRAKDKMQLFDCLKGCLTIDRSSLPYADVARQLDMTEGAVKVAVHRLRGRYRELLREEIAHTVDSPELVNDELQALFAAL